MSDYLATDAECAERDLRHRLWIGHGHKRGYGDDGEMQCPECPPGAWDYRRAPLAVVVDAAWTALHALRDADRERIAQLVDERVDAAALHLADESTIANMERRRTAAEQRNQLVEDALTRAHETFRVEIDNLGKDVQREAQRAEVAEGQVAALEYLRVLRFNETTGCLSGGDVHVDRCVCQKDDPTPHKHYAEVPYSCARCGHERCAAYTPAVPLAAAHRHDEAVRQQQRKADANQLRVLANGCNRHTRELLTETAELMEKGGK